MPAQISYLLVLNLKQLNALEENLPLGATPDANRKTSDTILRKARAVINDAEKRLARSRAAAERRKLKSDVKLFHKHYGP